MLLKKAPVQIKMTLVMMFYPIVFSNYCLGQVSGLVDGRIAGASSLHTSSRTDELRSYPDSLVYQFKPVVNPKADNELIHPLLFRIKLPTGLLHSYASGFDSFGFLYDDKQVVYVYLDRYSHNMHDTSYRIVNDDDINRLLIDDLNTINTTSKLDIDHNPFNPVRATWLIQRGKATILLYNIDMDNISHFFRYASSFTFL